MSTTFSKPSNYEQKMKWAKIWFNKLSAFHHVHSDKTENWNFSADQVIAYLRSRKDAKTPAWKRLKILEGIMNYRAVIQGRNVDYLVPLRNKMKEIILIERAREDEQSTVKPPVEYVNPRECDAIQQLSLIHI